MRQAYRGTAGTYQCKKPFLRLPCPRIPSCWEDPLSWAVQGADVPLAMGQGQGQGQGPNVPLVPTLSSAPRVCCELELPRDEVDVPMSLGSVMALPSAGFALEHCRISFLVSRLPSRLVSRFDPSASSINVYVPTCARVRTCNTAQHSTGQTV